MKNNDKTINALMEAMDSEIFDYGGGLLHKHIMDDFIVEDVLDAHTFMDGDDDDMDDGSYPYIFIIKNEATGDLYAYDRLEDHDPSTIDWQGHKVLRLM